MSKYLLSLVRQVLLATHCLNFFALASSADFYNSRIALTSFRAPPSFFRDLSHKLAFTNNKTMTSELTVARSRTRHIIPCQHRTLFDMGHWGRVHGGDLPSCNFQLHVRTTQNWIIASPCTVLEYDQHV